MKPFRRVDQNNDGPGDNNDDVGPAHFVMPPNSNHESIEESKTPRGGDGPGGNGPGPSGGAGDENYKMRAFKSTPNFMEALTDLGVAILNYDGDKKQFLIDGLKEINQGLPANIYIPFVNNSWRNYTILNVLENETKLFLTKNRAPYMVCLEIYRPEEILITA